MFVCLVQKFEVNECLKFESDESNRAVSEFVAEVGEGRRVGEFEKSRLIRFLKMHVLNSSMSPIGLKTNLVCI